MADYERRLQRLEDLTASNDDLPYISREASEKRTAELLNSKEVLSLPLPEVTEEEWAPLREALLAAAKLEMDKLKRIERRSRVIGCASE